MNGENAGSGRLINLGWKWNASALALLAAAGGAENAMAAPASDGSGWTLDLQGGYVFTGQDVVQFAQVGDTPPASDKPSTVLKGPFIGSANGYDVAATLSYQPPGSSWVFILDGQYGRTNNHSRTFASSYSGKYVRYDRTAHVTHSQEHYYIDFEVGRDFGVGLFGRGDTVVGGGVRYAHFSALTRGTFSTYSKYFFSTVSRSGSFTERRANNAVGPQIFIQQTSLLPGRMGDAGLSVGWGASGGVLFGRQTVDSSITQQVTSSGDHNFYQAFSNGSRAHNTITTDAALYLQLSWRPAHSPASFGVGYKAQVFFNALDGGYPSARNIDFFDHGPYADVQIHF